MNDEANRIKTSAQLLYAASVPIRILSHLSWKPEIRERFIRSKAQELPKEVVYPQFDPQPSLQAIEASRKEINHLAPGQVKAWLSRIADKLETSVYLLGSCATPEFLTHSERLFGLPTDTILDGKTTPLSLAIRFRDHFDSLSGMDFGAPDTACHLATTLAERMEKAVQIFGEYAPKIEIVDDLSANVLAGSGRVRIRRSACFSDLDLRQLVQHEIMIHVATSINGKLQSDLPILTAGHAGTTRTQEGLAVFAELISGSIDLDRFRRLADRVIAIQMAVEGADFLEVYRYFLERTGEEEQAFENTRRVFRGGTLHGGAPFTKDLVYLDGLLRVHNLLRIVVSSGRADCLSLLFAGKLDLEDLPALAELSRLGLCQPPKFLPTWAGDRRFLVAYLGYSSLLNSINLTKAKTHLQGLIDHIPKVNFQ